MLRRVRIFSKKNLGAAAGSQRDLAYGHVESENPKDWVPAPKGIDGCKLHKNKNEALGCLSVKFDASSYEQALEEARDTDKPVLVIFLESGAPGAMELGKTVLSHPLMVEAVESLFITISVNMAGTTPDDTRLLSRYHGSRHHETAIHIVNCKGQDLVLKLEGSRCSLGNIAKAMCGVLDRKSSKVPTYFKLLEAESLAHEAQSKTSRRVDHVILFKTRESTKAEIGLAELDGVVDIECGTVGRSGVVKIRFNPDVVDSKAIVLHAISLLVVDSVGCEDLRHKQALESEIGHMDSPPLLEELGSKRFTHGKDSKHYLRTTLFRYLPLTSLQALQANLAISKKLYESLDDLLSPRQLAILEAVETKCPRRDTVDVEINEAWARLQRDGVFDWN